MHVPPLAVEELLELLLEELLLEELLLEKLLLELLEELELGVVPTSVWPALTHSFALTQLASFSHPQPLESFTHTVVKVPYQLHCWAAEPLLFEEEELLEEFCDELDE